MFLSILSNRYLRWGAIIMVISLIALWVYSTQLRIRAAQLHLANEREVSRKLKDGELQITTKDQEDE